MKETILLTARPTRLRSGYWVRSVLVAVVLSALFASPAHAGTLYQSFGAFGLSGVSLANSTVSTGSYSGNATNLAVGGGKVYWQDGTSILDANTNLTGVMLFHTNNARRQILPSMLPMECSTRVLPASGYSVYRWQIPAGAQAVPTQEMRRTCPLSAGNSIGRVAAAFMRRTPPICPT